MRLLVLRCLVLLIFPAVVAGQKANDDGTKTVEIVIAATTDVHGRLRGWDYYSGTADTTGGLSRAATIIDSVRAANVGRVVLVDAGDFLQGSAITMAAARTQNSLPNPAIAAMNAMRYDAATIGNHEFDFGLPYLIRVRREATFPLLAANARAPNGSIAIAASRIVTRAGIRIGIVGATTPGAAVWDRDQLRGRLTLGDIVGAVRAETALLKRLGADVVVAVLHSGLNEPASYDSVASGLPSDNVAARVASEIDGIDAVIFGHSHKELADSTIGSALVMQPRNGAASVALGTLTLSRSATGWKVQRHRGQLVRAIGHRESEVVLAATARQHAATIHFVNSTLGTSAVAWRGDSSRVVDSPIVDFVLEVMRKRSGADLAATPSFALDAKIDAGPITLAQVARLYPYENTLRAVRLTGRQLRDYLEYSARYFADASSNKGSAGTLNSAIAGYNYDIIGGADYTLDLTRSVGSRVTRLEFKGRPIADTDSFTLALSNYRQAGGGGYAMFRGSPVVYDAQEDIRQLLINEVRARGTLDPQHYATRNWRLEPAGAIGAAYRAMRAAPPATTVSAGSARLRVIAMNDFHGALEPRRDSSGTLRGGAVALAAEITRARAECVAPACVSLLLDGGDEFQGTAASNFAFGIPVVKLLNGIGLAAAALGNHEFDWGQDTLRRRMHDAHYPILGANVRYADGSDVAWIPDDTILVAGDIRVGVIGIADTETPRTTRADAVADLRFLDPAPIIDERARALRARAAQFVIVVAHIGAFCDRRDSQRCDGAIISLAQRVTERIDAIVSGHTHSPIATVIRGAPVVQAWTRGSAIGVIDLPAEAGAQPTVELRDVLASRVTTPDSAVVAIVREATESLRERMSVPIARIGERIAAGETGALGNLIADAQRAAGLGDVAIMNTGGVRAALDTGTATYGALFEIQPFGNKLVRMTVSGRDLRAYLERVVSSNRIRAHLSGVRLRYDPAHAEGSRVLDVRLADDRAIDDTASYRLVMTDFLAGGGDGLSLTGTARKVEPLDIVDLDALIDYLRRLPSPVRAPTDQRLIPTTQ